MTSGFACGFLVILWFGRMPKGTLDSGILGRRVLENVDVSKKDGLPGRVVRAKEVDLLIRESEKTAVVLGVKIARTVQNERIGQDERIGRSETKVIHGSSALSGPGHHVRRTMTSHGVVRGVSEVGRDWRQWGL